MRTGPASLAPGLAVVLDGLSAPDGTGTGCRHGTPWYVSQLGPRLLTLAADPACSLVDALAEAIRQVAGLHPGLRPDPSRHPVGHHGAAPRPGRSEPTTSPWPTPCCCSTPPTGSRSSAMSGSTSSPARNAKPPTGCPPARPSSSGDVPSSPGHCGGHATDPAATGSPPPTPRPPARPSPARSLAGAFVAPCCSATAPAGSSTRSSSPPGRSCWRCWTRAARTSCSARSELLRPSTPRAGSGPGPSAATTPPPSTSSATMTSPSLGRSLDGPTRPSWWEPRSPTTPRVEGSGRTVLACPTPSRKRPTNQPGTCAELGLSGAGDPRRAVPRLPARAGGCWHGESSA